MIPLYLYTFQPRVAKDRKEELAKKVIELDKQKGD
jgi:hypothetical protein